MRQALAKILLRCNKYRSAPFSELLKVGPGFGQTIITSYHSYQVVVVSWLLWLRPHSIIQDTFLPQEITEGSDSGMVTNVRIPVQRKFN
jgi:hypothetical protein